MHRPAHPNDDRLCGGNAGFDLPLNIRRYSSFEVPQPSSFGTPHRDQLLRHTRFVLLRFSNAAMASRTLGVVHAFKRALGFGADHAYLVLNFLVHHAATCFSIA